MEINLNDLSAINLNQSNIYNDVSEDIDVTLQESIHEKQLTTESSEPKQGSLPSNYTTQKDKQRTVSAEEVDQQETLPSTQKLSNLGKSLIEESKNL